jgi:ribosomal protein S18 acetylase RimI-like enzyme
MIMTDKEIARTEREYSPNILTLIDSRPPAPEGCYILWRKGSGPTVEICEIEVPNEHRKKSWGRKMVIELKKRVPGDTVLIYAITSARNIIAQQFYTGCGFRPIAPLWNFYQDIKGEKNALDAVMYGLDLKRIP